MLRVSFHVRDRKCDFTLLFDIDRGMEFVYSAYRCWQVKEKYLVMGIQEYAKRLGPYIKFQMIEVADEKAPDTLSEAEVRQVKEREGERILTHVKSEAHVIVLAIDGKLWSSEELAEELDKLGTYGTSHVVFVIGGSHGL